MSRKKEDNSLYALVGTIKHYWRHRKGHEIPGLILDTFDNLGFVTKDERKPVIKAERKTEYGWHLTIHLPPGISFGDVRRNKEYFENATNSWIDLMWKNGKVQMSIKVGTIPESVSYSWDPAPYEKMWLPVPLGVAQKGLEVFDLAESPHLLIGGVPGFGKSNFLHVLIHALLPKAMIGIIDMKRLEFSYLSKHCALSKNESQALVFMKALNQEMERRIDILEKLGLVKVQEYSGDDMPMIVLVIDEVAEIQDENIIFLVDRIVRLARAVGISVVAATQRPSKKVKLFADDTRDMFLARLSFQMADEISSRIILGEQNPEAAYLPAIKGRGLFKYGQNVKEIQSMHLPIPRAKELIVGHPERRWDYISSEPKRKRLPPR
jgi:S-DNA-T family DNA segregation ATPase FtsK/SpoIIIE